MITRRKKYSVFFILLSVFANSDKFLMMYAQPSGLGWTGDPIIPIEDFTDSENWVCNYQSETGDTCHVTSDSSSLNLHWKFSVGKRYKYAQCYRVLNPAISLQDVDIMAIDVKGSHCGDHRNIKIKFEDGDHQAAYTWENLARIPRWCERISVLKNQFTETEKINWDRISVISFEVCSDESDVDVARDSGTVSFRGLQSESVSHWQRATSLETIHDMGNLQAIKHRAMDAILARQSPTGLFYTWLEDSSSYLYGHGLILKLFAVEGKWKGGRPDDPVSTAAEQLALFLIENQDTLGFWPRAWHTRTGTIRQYLEQDSTIWFGDFPWVITGLQNYYSKSKDVRVAQSMDKAKSFLYDMIDSNGRLNTINPITKRKKEVTSSEAYAATLLALLELGDDSTAKKMFQFVNDHAWDENLKYWKEGTTSSRIVLFANTWLSQIATLFSDSLQAAEALSFVGKALFTRGPGAPWGFDGVGPIATWYEGTLSYICSGGPGSQFLLDNIIHDINTDGSVPHYNDTLGSMAGIWAVQWSSLDGTAWLCFAASKISPFDTTNISIHDSQEKPNQFILYQNHPNPFNPITKITYRIQKTDLVTLKVYDILGKEIQTLIHQIQKENTYSVFFNAENLASGIYFYRLTVGNDFIATQKMLLLR